MRPEKYKILKELIYEWIERETENLLEIRKDGHSNTVGEGMAMGAQEAYHQILNDINELEKEAIYE